MSRVINSIELKIDKSDSILGFETTGGGDWKIWDRFLTIDGKKAYHIGNICGTCSFFFERLDGANRSISPENMISTLSKGVESMDKGIVNEVAKVMPSGNYYINLLNISPHLVTIGNNNDYFTNEQVEVWGIDGFWGFPHHPKIRYYRGETKKISNNKILFEFFVPMFPQTWLDNKTVDQFKANIHEGIKPTAISISVLDIKEHYEAENSHWCLTHYIIDGHHKMFAASETKRPITLLSFLTVEQGISSIEEIKELIKNL